VVKAGSSLGYNYDMFGSSYSNKFGDHSTSPFTTGADDYTVTESGLENWVFDVMYELQIDDVGSIDIASLSGVQSWLSDINFHISPSKQGKFSTTVTPVPGAVWLLGSGLVGLAALRKKSKKA